MGRTIGGNIRKRREDAGFKVQGEFARELGVPQARLSDWENDRYDAIELSNLLKIAKTLKCSVGDLLSGTDYDIPSARAGAPGALPTVDAEELADLAADLRGHAEIVMLRLGEIDALVQAAGVSGSGGQTPAANRPTARRTRRAR